MPVIGRAISNVLVLRTSVEGPSTRTDSINPSGIISRAVRPAVRLSYTRPSRRMRVSVGSRPYRLQASGQPGVRNAHENAPNRSCTYSTGVAPVREQVRG